MVTHGAVDRWRPTAFVDTSIMPLEVFLCQLCIRTRLV
jgi:hypothetical protein